MPQTEGEKTIASLVSPEMPYDLAHTAAQEGVIAQPVVPQPFACPGTTGQNAGADGLINGRILIGQQRDQRSLLPFGKNGLQ